MDDIFGNTVALVAGTLEEIEAFGPDRRGRRLSAVQWLDNLPVNDDPLKALRVLAKRAEDDPAVWADRSIEEHLVFSVAALRLDALIEWELQLAGDVPRAP